MGSKGTIPKSDAESVLDVIGQMLETGTFDSSHLPGDPVIRQRLDEIVVTIGKVQNFALCISKGDLECRLDTKGILAGSFKFLHSNLRHLTWQAQQIAAGDFSQRVDFMGEFSEAFNHMVVALEAARAEMKQRELELSTLNAQLSAEVTVRRQAEEHLDQQFRFLQQLTDTIPNPIFYKDAKGVYAGCNTAFEKYIGLPKDQIAGKSVYDISLKELADKYFAKDKELFDHPGTQIYESRVKYADGSIHDVIFNKATFSDLQGNVQGLVGVIVDITERKRIEEALERSYAVLIGVVESPKEVVIFALDRQYRYIAFNKNHHRTMKRIWGVDIALGNSMLDYIRSPEDRKKAVINFDRALAGESFTVTEVYGDTAHVRLWYEDIYNPITDENGNVIGLTLFLTDITERKLAEEAIRESEQKFRDIFNNTTDAIHIHGIRDDGTPGRFTDVNDVTCRILGYTKEEMLTKTPLDIATNYHNPPIEKILEEQRTTGRTRFETEHRAKDGTIIPVEVNTHVVTIQGAKVMLGVVRDITERKQAEEALQQANKKLNLLSSITRHDILNQLQVMKGYLELSRDVLNDQETLSEFLKKEEDAARNIERQIVFTKEYHDLGVKAPVWQPVDVCVKKAQESLPIRDIRVVMDCPDMEVFADPMFEKVFYNLIDNALRYGGPGMTIIRISSHESEQGSFISIEDDGVGISAEDKNRVFERGFGHHTGLGLFLSREILAITGITITEAGEPGKGARFEILVPKGGYRLTDTR